MKSPGFPLSLKVKETHLHIHGPVWVFSAVCAWGHIYVYSCASTCECVSGSMAFNCFFPERWKEVPAVIDWMEGWERRAREWIGRHRGYKRGRETVWQTRRKCDKTGWRHGT